MSQPTELNKKIFFVALFAFLLLAAYGIYYAEMRMQFEAAEDTILTCQGGFRIPYYRYAYILNKLFFVGALKLHLPFKEVAVLYSLNDALFYLGIAFAIVFFTRRYDYAATVLAVPVMLHDSVFYYIANEIFLSGAVMLLYAAVHQHMKEGLIKTRVLAVSIFFIVWSHPLTLVIFAVFLPFMYPSVLSIKKDWKIVLFLFVNTLCRVALLSNYDHYKLGQMSGSFFEPHYWYTTSVRYFDDYGYLIVIGIGVVLAIYRSKQKMRYAGLLLFPILLGCCNAMNSTVGDPYFIKFLYPVQLFLLLLGIVYLHELPTPYKRWAPLVAGFFLFVGGQRLIEHNHNSIYNRTEMTMRLNTLCATQDSSQSKWYITQDSLNLPFFGTDECHESLFYSEYKNQGVNVQFAQVKNEEVSRLDSVPEDMILANMRIEYPIIQLDSYYFHVHPGKYRELKLDADKRHFLTEGLDCGF